MGSLGIQPFQTTFAVPLHCDACVKDVSGALNKLGGITKIEARVHDQLIFVEGTAAPSSIVSAIESTGRDAILRGSGKSNSAGVCILETHSTVVSDQVRGLARMVQVADNVTLVDLTLKGVSAGTYHASVHERGDISQGAVSTGGIWEAVKNLADFSKQDPAPRGILGTIQVGKDGRGSTFLDRAVSVWEIIGRSIVVSKRLEGPFSKDDPDTLVGVIARSAGVWDNQKTVCSCSGKTVWEERKEQQETGML
jgi:copper chaperone for superoxide dismutase